MNGIESEKYWTTSIAVEAFQLTEENFKQVADYLEGFNYIDLGPDSSFVYLSDEVHIGEWAVEYEDGRYSFFTDLEFKKFFLSHDQRLADDEKYAKVFLLVKSAMNKQDSATYHDRGGSDEMSLVAIETTKALLREI